MHLEAHLGTACVHQVHLCRLPAQDLGNVEPAGSMLATGMQTHHAGARQTDGEPSQKAPGEIAFLFKTATAHADRAYMPSMANSQKMIFSVAHCD